MSQALLTDELSSLTTALNNGSSQIEDHEASIQKLKSQNLKLTSKCQELEMQMKQIILNIEEKRRIKSALIKIKSETIIKSNNNISSAANMEPLNREIDSSRIKLDSKEEDFSILSEQLEKLRKWNEVLRNRKLELMKHNYSYTLQELKDLYGKKIIEAKKLETNNSKVDEKLKEVETKIGDALNKLKSTQSKFSQNISESREEKEASVIKVPIRMSKEPISPDALKPIFNRNITTTPAALLRYTAKPFKQPKCEISHSEKTPRIYGGQEDSEEEIFITDPPCQQPPNEIVDSAKVKEKDGNIHRNATPGLTPSNNTTIFDMPTNKITSVNSNESNYIQGKRNISFNPIRTNNSLQPEANHLNSSGNKSNDGNNNTDENHNKTCLHLSCGINGPDRPLFHRKYYDNDTDETHNDDGGGDEEVETSIDDEYKKKITTSNPRPHSITDNDEILIDDPPSSVSQNRYVSSQTPNRLIHIRSRDGEEDNWSDGEGRYDIERRNDIFKERDSKSPILVVVPSRGCESLEDLRFYNGEVVLRPKRWSHQLELMPHFCEVNVIKPWPKRCHGKKGNLRKVRLPRDLVSSDKRVTFEPLVLLFNATIEGELDLVKDAIYKLGDINVNNDDGMTSLHHAIFGEQFHIVTYLVEEGCDLNSPDIDGWTPLHCAASCNDVQMCEFLIENGASVFATTLDDHELPSEKCDNMENNYQKALDYLLQTEDQMGKVNNGVVYALYDFTEESDDELSFSLGDCLIVLSKGENDEEWWWCCLEGREGYVPRNLIGMYPRVVPR